MKSEKIVLPNISNSLKIHKKASGLIPCTTQMLAKGTQQHSKGVAPIYIERGKGGRVWDVDGNEFVDTTMGMGPISLGYCYDRVDTAIKLQLEKGINWTLVDELEYEVAELFNKLVPNAEMIRFGKTGADATTAAVRLARAYTGKDKIICCGYHGWHDWYIGATSRNRGVPIAIQKLTTKIGYNDIGALEQAIDENVACFILEPVVFQEPDKDYLLAVKELCNRKKIVLIFDEVWTGFRIATGGAQSFFDITPDLATFSKACSNGMPFSALTGKTEIMRTLERDDTFFFTTFGGEALSLAATLATVNEIHDKDVTRFVSNKCAFLRNTFNDLVKENEIDVMRFIGLDYRSTLIMDPVVKNPLAVKTLLQQELIRHHVLWTGFHHLSFSHTDDDIEVIVNAYKRALPIIKDAIDNGTVEKLLVGEEVHPVFRNLGIGQH